MEGRARKPLIAAITLIALMGGAYSGGSSSSVSAATSSGDASAGASSSGGSGTGVATCPAGIAATDFTRDASFTITTEKDYAFHPNCIIAKSGSTITIKNEDAETHNFTIVETDVDLMIPSGHAKDQAISLSPATYYFYCTIHQGMTGTMTVVS